MTLIIPSRRGFILGATASLITAPAIIRSGILMPIKKIILPEKFDFFCNATRYSDADLFALIDEKMMLERGVGFQ